MEWLTFLLFLQMTSAASLGCYKSSAFSGSGTSYTYQSLGYCTIQCSGYKYAAMTNGNSCLCTNDEPSDDDKASDENCSLTCSGYPSDTCGGDGYFSVFSIGGSSDSSDNNNNSTLVTSSFVRQSATTRTSTSFSLSVTNGRTVTSAVVVQTTQSFSNVYVTYTASASSGNNSNSTSNSDTNNSSPHSSSPVLSKGAIAGIVVGSVAAVALAVAAAFIVWRHKRNSGPDNPEIAAALVAHKYNGEQALRQHSVLPSSDYEKDLEFGSTGDMYDDIKSVHSNSSGPVQNANVVSSKTNLRIANPE